MTVFFKKISFFLFSSVLAVLGFLCFILPAQADNINFLLASAHKFSSDQAPSFSAKKSDSAADSPACISRATETKRKPASQSKQNQFVSGENLQKKLSSRSAIIIDSQTGRTLYAHNQDQPGQPASTIKVLTGLISINSLRDSEMVKASRRAAGMPRSKIYLEEGISYAADDLINAVLLASANDASVALAEKVAGSEGSFAKLMTAKAKALGAKNTVCKTATGLTAKGQMSTVSDLAAVFDKAMKDEDFASRIGKSKVKTSYGKLLRNHNKALWRVKGAVGGKTGYTRAARQTYVGKFSRDDGDLIVAIMGSETMWDDISRLVEYGFARKQQLAALEKIVPSSAAPSKRVTLAEILPVYQKYSLQVLTGTQKNSSL